MLFARDKSLLIVPLTATTIGAMRQEMEDAARAGAQCAECRLDFLQPPPTRADLQTLLENAPLPVLVTNRPTRQGGRFDGPEAERLEILRQAAQFASAADVEDDVPRQDWPDGQVLLSHHDFKHVPANLPQLLHDLQNSPAGAAKLAFAAAGPQDALLALDMLRGATKPTISLAMGEAGLLSRILAKKLHGAGTFATLRKGRESAPGQPTVEELKAVYRWDTIQGDTQVYGLIGCPISHSMSPAIHNAAFAATGLNAVYVPLRIEPGRDNFNRFMDALLERPWLDWRGLSVTLPHKENALAYVGPQRCSELSVRIGAINTIAISPDGELAGDNTDYAAAIDALCSTMLLQRRDMRGRSIAILGAGGVARALVAALTFYGADVTIYNRTPDRAQRLADEFAGSQGDKGAAEGKCWALPWSKVSDLSAEIVINCTPIGMHPHVEASPLNELPPQTRVVFDTIYNPIETRLLKTAHASGCQIVTGLDMFVNQAVGQFETWTSRTAPRETMRQVVIARLARTL